MKHLQTLPLFKTPNTLRLKSFKTEKSCITSNMRSWNQKIFDFSFLFFFLRKMTHTINWLSKYPCGDMTIHSLEFALLVNQKFIWVSEFIPNVGCNIGGKIGDWKIYYSITSGQTPSAENDCVWLPEQLLNGSWVFSFFLFYVNVHKNLMKIMKYCHSLAEGQVDTRYHRSGSWPFYIKLQCQCRYR